MRANELLHRHKDLQGDETVLKKPRSLQRKPLPDARNVDSGETRMLRAGEGGGGSAAAAAGRESEKEREKLMTTGAATPALEAACG
jgi:hypothetical protein